ncbi:hypothetical protein KL918_005032 [Ogataea parapolymorpha]|uniref:Zn(2)-C6 fungal-type domain-containing protein n=1 Tax=Ogataea parapolymorpha (strain ATCC 26012 / BCRC 20466 / JCM 22074 / NRRL Y-7560 / DL-1) TaxID=871575 RepID=W1QJF6_OGAPD|nr:hypothetical protein HPODL_04746 [Ogataea parapolymorpha DL-1]ESX01982.1 hypothetical protein HPODL_04746 [Ogataea parapolymorpha DL-1]KAG7864906.1 hypothetical protein KL918_005032 [Ogataea parapolymorpha]KAG7871592.1 hypothetical protein KL916_003943 [Ogataea parapolymorpha]
MSSHNPVAVESPIFSDTTEISSDVEHSHQISRKPQSEGFGKRRSVACKACHALKVKCVPGDPKNQLGACVRCLKANRACEFDLTQSRKKKKPSGPGSSISRFRLLESRLKELQDLLELKNKTIDQQAKTIAKQQHMMISPDVLNDDSRHQVLQTPPSTVNPNSQSYTTTDKFESLSSTQRFEKEIKFLESVSKEQSLCSTSAIVNISEQRIRMCKANLNYRENDIITRGLLTEEQCDRLFQMFLDKILPKSPILQMPRDTTLASMRQKKPLLLLSCVYVATILDEEPCYIPLELQLRIETLVFETLIGEILLIGEKSLELLKSLLLLCIWYIPPELFQHRRYHMINCLCVSMLHDLGMTGRPYFFYSKEEGAVKKRAACAFEDPEDLESKSLLLLTYFNSVSISLFLRKRLPVQWTDYCDQYCIDLEATKEPRYIMVSIYSRLNCILEKIHYGINSTVEQPTAIELDYGINKYITEEIRKKLNTLKGKIIDFTKDDEQSFHSMMSYFFSVQAYLHEPALQAMFSSNMAELGSLPDYLAEAIECSTESCVLALKHFLHLKEESITVEPFFHSSRIIFTAGMLLRIRYLSISIPVLNQYGCMTEDTMNVVKSLASLVYRTSLKYPRNHFLNKMRLVLSLFTQTFLSQCKSAFKSLLQNKLPSELSEKSGVKSAQHAFVNPFANSHYPPGNSPNISHETSYSSPTNVPKENANTYDQNGKSSVSLDYAPDGTAASLAGATTQLTNPQFQQNLPSPVIGSQEVLPPHIQPALNYSASENSMAENLEYQYWALNDEFWSTLFVNIDGRSNEQDLNNFYMNESLNKL